MANNKYFTNVKPRLFEIKNWCREGLIDEEIAKRLGVSWSSFQNYKRDHQELKDSLKEGKTIADYKVENSLFKRANGYKYNEVTKERKLNKKTGEYEVVVSKVVEKEIAPDPTSMIFWLKNRKTSHWKDKQDINLDGNLNIDNKYSYLSDDEIDGEIKKMEKMLNEQQK